MEIQKAIHIFLLCIGTVVAIIGTLGMFGFGPGESIIVLILLALVDLILRLSQTSKSNSRG